MSSFDEIITGYDKAAPAYAEKFLDELDGKPKDRSLLAKFAELVKRSGREVLDVGCGTGHTTEYLSRLGLQATGVDLSNGMIAQAKERFPLNDFCVGNMFDLAGCDASTDGILAFYCIVHCLPTEIGKVFDEFSRVLKPNAILLLSFHCGTDIVENGDFLGSGASLTFYFHETKHVESELLNVGFELLDVVERQPYKSEYPSTRGYILAENTPPSHMSGNASPHA